MNFKENRLIYFGYKFNWKIGMWKINNGFVCYLISVVCSTLCSIVIVLNVDSLHTCIDAYTFRWFILVEFFFLYFIYWIKVYD